MDQDVYKAQILPLANDPIPTVTTYLLCRNSLVRTGVEHLLTGSRFAIAGDGTAGVPDLPASEDNPSTLVLITERLSFEGYLELIEGLKVRCPSARLVLIADHLASSDAFDLVKAGLNGICPSVMSPEALRKALEIVMLGEAFLPASMVFELLSQPSRPRPKLVVSNDKSAGIAARFSDRETQILRLLVTGASNKMIARELGLAEATIKVHLKAILRKANVENRTQAAMWAAQHFDLTDDAQPLKVAV